MVTDPHTYTHNHQQTGPITIHCAAASAQCKNGTLSSSQFMTIVLLPTQVLLALFNWPIFSETTPAVRSVTLNLANKIS